MMAETRRKIGESLKGRHLSEDHRRKISESLTGRPRSEEDRRKISEGKKANPLSDETRKKMSKSHKGRRLTDETRRKMSEAKKGEKHPRWRGGTSFEPYCILFNNEFRERVRAFFGYLCINCGKSQSENLTKIGKVRCLTVHHVNYRKDSCCVFDAPRLFVPLCLKCHNKTQHNRLYWERYFTEVIMTKFDGNCYLPKKEN